MKKVIKSERVADEKCNRNLRVMKVSILLFFLCISGLTAETVYAQQKEQITGRATGERLPDSKIFVQAFEQLPQQDLVISTHDPFNFQFNKDHGHLQGIQLYRKARKDYLYMTRSDPSVSYMLKAKLKGKKATVLSIDTLMHAPYMHPGGFQIFGNYLAVGIEDDDARNTSRVVVYDLEKGDTPWSDPLHVIKRDGEYERVTAGCVGLTQVGNHILMGIGNWHCRNLDFYICSLDKFKKGEDGFQLIQSMNMAQVSKVEWSDSIWRSYQNINLFSDGENQLYLVGFDGGGTDLYELQIADGTLESIQNPAQDVIQIKKLKSRSFTVSGNASFGAGAGINRLPNGKMMMFVAPGDVGGSSTISSYSTKKK